VKSWALGELCIHDQSLVVSMRGFSSMRTNEYKLCIVVQLVNFARKSFLENSGE